MARVGKIRKKFSTTLMAFMPRLTSMGVRVSPEARSALLRIKDRARKISGAQTMEKYSAPSRRISGSAFSQPGRCGAIHWVSSVSSAPEISAIQTACMAALRAVRSSFAPTARATQASTPMPSAHRGELVSHVTVVVRPTAAVACTPSRPTMAESAYCTQVCSACSSMAGQASATTVASSGRFD